MRWLTVWNLNRIWYVFSLSISNNYPFRGTYQWFRRKTSVRKFLKYFKNGNGINYSRKVWENLREKKNRERSRRWKSSLVTGIKMNRWTEDAWSVRTSLGTTWYLPSGGEDPDHQNLAWPKKKISSLTMRLCIDFNILYILDTTCHLIGHIPFD